MALFGLPGWFIGCGRGFGRTALIRGGCGYALFARFALYPVVRIGEVYAGGQAEEERKREGAFGRFHQNILPNYVPDSGLPRADSR